MSWTKDIRIVVGLDFGTTYSGFTYCHVSNKNLRTHDIWPGNMSELKANTVLLYDDELKKVAQWGKPALSKRPSRRKAENKPVKLFKLHLGNLQEHLKPKLLVDYKKAITDYLHEIGKLIKETVMKSWPGIDFLENVLLVLTVPAEYSDISKATLRECVFDADLISNKFSEKLQFTTEPEAAAAYCMENVLKEHDLDISGTKFMIVDCGGGTVDLTTRQVEGKQLGEITERAGDYCGSTFIEDKFIEISVPSNPIAAISRGAAIYGVSFNEVDEIRCIISSRVLKFTYGIGVYSLWEEGDPEERRNSDGYIRRFHCIARRGKSIPIDKDIFVEGNLFPYYSSQTAVDFQIYYTRELDAKFCDETGMEPLGKLRMDLPDPHRGCDRPLTFGLKFGRMEITATAINDTDGQNYQVAFDIETEN
ncbi:unnamed protein product [Rhizophagus irregularis]|nr:unnamed protein product [Rhizophagus irregularis]